MKKRDEYIKTIEIQFEEWNQEIDKLAERVEQHPGERKASLLQQLDELREKGLEAEKRLGELRKSPNARWEELSERVDNAWSDMKESLVLVSKNFEEPYAGLEKEDIATTPTEVGTCGAEKCVYNRNAKCHAMSITIGSSHAKCDTFMMGGELGGVEKETGAVGACHMKNCRFNERLECTAVAITVETHSGHADCITFVER